MDYDFKMTPRRIQNINFQKMLRNSRRQNRDRHSSCQTSRSKNNLNRWIQLNKKQFLINNKRFHCRSYSLDNSRLSQARKVQIVFSSPNKNGISQKFRTRSHSSASSSRSNQKQSANFTNQEIIRRLSFRTNSGNPNKALIFQISSKSQKNEIRGLKGSNLLSPPQQKQHGDDKLIKLIVNGIKIH